MLLRQASSTCREQELFLGNEHSPWLVHVSGILFHQILVILPTARLLNELEILIILNRSLSVDLLTSFHYNNPVLLSYAFLDNLEV